MRRAHCDAMVMTPRVSRQSQIITHGARFLLQPTEFARERHIAISQPFAYNEDRKPPQTFHLLGPVPDANAAFIFLPLFRIISCPLSTFNRPLVAVLSQQGFGIGLVGTQTCDAIGLFDARFANGLSLRRSPAFPFNPKALLDTGEFNIAVKLGCRPNRPRFSAAVLCETLVL